MNAARELHPLTAASGGQSPGPQGNSTVVVFFAHRPMNPSAPCAGEGEGEGSACTSGMLEYRRGIPAFESRVPSPPSCPPRVAGEEFFSSVEHNPWRTNWRAKPRA